MSITIPNILPGISSAGEIPVDEMMASPMPLPATVENGNDAPGESEFWSMLSQQFDEVVTQGDVQVIENKDLLSLINEFEASLEQSNDDSLLTTEWMQILKSHFDGVPLKSEIQDISPQAETSLTEMQTDKVINLQQLTLLNGEGLPLMWQDQAANKPLEFPAGLNQLEVDTQKINFSILQPLDKKIVAQQIEIAKPSASFQPISIDEISTDFKDIESLAAGDGSNKADLISDKVIQNQLSREMINPFNKAAESMSPLQHNAPVSLQPASSAQTQQGQVLPSTLQPLSLQPQAQASQWGEAIGERVSLLINHKLNHAEIRIDPPHLGKLDIQIQVKDDSAVVIIQTQHAQTRDLIDAASVRLRDYLQDAGYSSVDVNVSHRDQSEHQEGFSQQNSSSADTDVAGQDNDNSGNHDNEQVIQIRDGMIDYFA